MSEHAHALNRIIRGKPFQAILALLRASLGAVFLYAGATKIMDPAGFSQAVYNYHLLPGWLVNIIAIVLPWIEVIAGASLVLGLCTSGGAIIVSALLLTFTIALAINLFRGLDIACGCFSTSPTAGKITWWYLLRDSSLSAASLLVLFLDQRMLSLEAYLPARRMRK